MLLSMTGYGRATLTEAGKTYSAEIRSLNSKQSDLRLRSSHSLHAREVQLRKLVLAASKRGKLEMTLEIREETTTGKIKIDLQQLALLSDQVIHQLGNHATQPLAGNLLDGLVPALLRVPGILDTAGNETSDGDWPSILAVSEACLERLHTYRLQEGAVLSDDLRTSVTAIKQLLEAVDQYADQRIGVVRERMSRHLQEYMGRANVDKNRYEQEVLFYLEKMDINEERVRLAQNCDYFLEVLNNDDEVKGRKLTFISQEIGREINTLGAKAYSADIQKLVVNMKEHLEMIKEQLANVA